MQQNFRNIAEFYTLTNKLKQIIRSGLLQWDVSAPRLESVAEHIFGAQMLAIALWSELDYDIDLQKVVLMLAIHDVGETIIGDITPLDQISDKEKHAAELEAITQIFSGLSEPKLFIELFEEFEQRQTPEAKFARQIDKLETELQVKLYDQAGYCDKDTPRTGFDEEIRQKYIVQNGAASLSDAWFDYDLEHQSYDEKILEFIKWLKNNDIKEKKWK